MHNLHRPFFMTGTENTRNNYNRLSGVYDFISLPERRFSRKALKLLDPSPEENYLEIGPGTGYTLCLAARLCKHVTGIDISEKMLLRSEAKLKKQKITNFSLIRADACTLPFGNETFQCILSAFTFEILNDEAIDRALSECMRVLVPGGRLVIANMNAPERSNPMDKLYLASRTLFPGVVDCRSIRINEHIEKQGFSIINCITGRLYGLSVMMGLSVKPAMP